MEPEPRRTQIIRLLATRDDNLPIATRREHSVGGFVHRVTHRESCQDCLANDRIMFSCETCGGRGYVEEMVERDPYAQNDTVQPYGLDGTYLERVKYRDQQIELMRNQLARPLPTEGDLLEEANLHPHGWEIERRRMYVEFDYPALDTLLELLREHDVGAYQALHAAYVYGWVEPSTSFESACERGLTFLDTRLPTPLRVPPPPPEPKLAEGRVARAAGRDVMAERDSEIRRAVLEANIPTEDVARTWGISARQVNRIISRSEAA